MKKQVSKKWKQVITGILALCVVVLFPGIFLYCQNVDVSRFSEIWSATVAYLGIAGIVAIGWGILLRNFSKAIFMSQISMLYLMNFNNIHMAIAKYEPDFHRSIELLVGGTVLLLLSFFIKKKVKSTIEICSIIGIVFGGLIVFNFIVASPKIVKRIEAVRNQQNNQQIENSDLANRTFTSQERPNVYYVVLDEYAGFENIARYYDFDNKEFEEFLINESYNISYTSHNTESIFTYSIVPNLLNLDYVVSMDMDELDCWEKTKTPALYQLFWNNGYQVNMINHWGTLNADGCNVLNTNIDKETLSDYLVEDGILDFIHDFFFFFETYHGKRLKETLELMSNCVDYVPDDTPTFTMVYLMCPHTPYALDENGNYTEPEAYNNMVNRNLYVNELIYVNKCLEKMTDNIKEKDPNALIIIQSDHGRRYPYQMKIENKVPYDASVETIYMQNILNCVYYRGEKIDIEGLSGVNTLRKVLNEVFGTDYEIIENPPVWNVQK